jgi:hypothetical protein
LLFKGKQPNVTDVLFYLRHHECHCWSKVFFEVIWLCNIQIQHEWPLLRSFGRFQSFFFCNSSVIGSVGSLRDLGNETHYTVFGVLAYLPCSGALNGEGAGGDVDGDGGVGVGGGGGGGGGGGDGDVPLSAVRNEGHFRERGGEVI